MAKLAQRFGVEVRARRKARRLTQAQLADAASMSEEWVRRLERGAGAPSFDALEALASALGVSVADLFVPMSPRDARLAGLERILSDLSEDDLGWIEGVIRAVIARPAADQP